MNHLPDSERAISDVFGAVILIGVIVSVFAVAGVMMFSQPQPQKIPAINAIITNNTNQVKIQHGGGDSFNFADVQILLDGQPTNFTKDGTSDWSTGSWSVGQSLTYDVPAGQAVPSSIQIVYKGGGVSQLIAQSGEGGASNQGTLPVPAPVVTAITPNSGYIGEVVSITNLAGSDFFNGASVKLRRTGYTDIVASSVVVVSPIKITCSFNLAGSTLGDWDVVVTNPAGPSGTLTNGFTVIPVAPPVVDFSGTPLSGKVPLPVSFTDSSTNFPSSWSWIFGDGDTSTLKNPTHTYVTPGNYSVSLTATNSVGSGNLTKTNYIWVKPPVTYTITATATPPGGSISPSGAVSVVEGTSQSFNISASTGYSIADVLVDGASQGMIPGYTFSNVAANHTINATFAINQYTITATSGANGNVTPAGSTLVNYGANQTYNITPITGYHVNNVLVNNASVGSVTTYQFTNVAANQTISASFAINTYTITPLVSGGNGNVSPATVQTVNYGATPTFNFTPVINYHLNTVTVNSIPVTPSGNSYTFPPVTEDKTIIGTFMIDPPVANFTGSPRPGAIPLNVTFTDLSTNSPTSWLWNFGDGQYSTLQNPSNIYSAAGNYSVRLEATNAGGTNVSVKDGYVFTYIPAVANFTNSTGYPRTGPASLTVYFTDLSTGSPYNFLWHFGDIAIVNTSTLQNPGHTYDDIGLYSVNLTVANSYSSSSLVRAGYINVTTPIPEVYIFPNTTSGFAPLPVLFEGLASNSPTSWLWDFDDGTPPVTTMDATHTFANPGSYNVSLTATNAGGSGTAYEMITVTGFGITASSGPNGNVTPSGETILNAGASQAYAITPITGYKIANVLVDGVSNGTVSSYTFTNVQANHTISATFALRTFNITATAGANGAIIPNGTITLNYGASQAFTFVPAKKYHTQTMVVDGVTTTYPPKIDSPYTFNNVQDNHSISVTFAKNLRQQIFYDPFDITPSSNGWTIVSHPDWQTSAPRNGTYSIRFRGSTATGPDEAIHRSVPTTGYSEINVSYQLGAQSLDSSSEYFAAQYSTNAGGSYTDITRITGPYTGGTTFTSYTSGAIPTAADNQASNFRVRIGIWASATNDYGWIDDVKVTGIPDYI